MMNIYELIDLLLGAVGAAYIGGWSAEKLIRWHKLRKGYLREIEVGEGKYTITTSSAEETERIVNKIIQSSEQSTKEEN